MFCYPYLADKSGHPMLWWLCVTFQTLAWNAQGRANQIKAVNLRFWTKQRVSKWMNEWTNERTNERMNELMHDGWINGWMDHEGMNEWMNE